MEPYLLDWLNLLVRWLHLIAGIAWIGASFYFVMLDNSLSKPKRDSDVARGVSGELWAVHGGGFYVSQKFLLGPQGEPLSDSLHWSKWEAYTTWLSGMGMLALVYWLGASTYLIDRNVLALSPAVAIAIGIGVIVAGWIVYDALCRLLTGRDDLLAAFLFVLVMLATYGLFQVFSGRAAFIHVGAILGTIMAANVFVHIIPGQKAMVADIRAGRTPDAMPGIVGKQRSVHNTYFTLPVLFTMLSNHYPMTYSHPQGWLVLGGLMLAGVLIRQFFVLRHKQGAKPALLLVAAVLLAALIVWLAPALNISGAKADYAALRHVLDTRCVVCHAAQPKQPGFAQPPKGVLLETPEQVAQHAAKVAETVGNRYRPIGNLTQMTDAERAIVAGWYAGGAPTR
jgi:uncharacterized membrane protein